jgi:dTDP-4-dehydrorhamnose reductase
MAASDPSAAYSSNVTATALLCEAAKQCGAHLTYVSTDYVFDGERGNYDVDDMPNPRGVYAITKHMSEQAVRCLMPSDSFAIARTAVVFGWPNAGKNNFGSWLIDSLSQKKPVKLFVDQFVSASLALNVADMLAELSTKRLGGIWHVAGASPMNRLEFGQKLCAQFGFDPSLLEPSTLADVKLASVRPKRSTLNVSRTAAALDHAPYSIEQALKLVHDEYLGSSRQ